MQSPGGGCHPGIQGHGDCAAPHCLAATPAQDGSPAGGWWTLCAQRQLPRSPFQQEGHLKAGRARGQPGSCELLSPQSVPQACRVLAKDRPGAGRMLVYLGHRVDPRVSRLSAASPHTVPVISTPTVTHCPAWPRLGAGSRGQPRHVSSSSIVLGRRACGVHPPVHLMALPLAQPPWDISILLRTMTSLRSVPARWPRSGVRNQTSPGSLGRQGDSATEPGRAQSDTARGERLVGARPGCCPWLCPGWAQASLSLSVTHTCFSVK